MMIQVLNESHDPYFNLALEEYVISQMPDEYDYFFLWQNEPTIVVGRNQNTIEEINLDFVKERGIKIARRMSGGGAVYHDFGNLNYTFIVRENGHFHDFNFFTRYLIDTLNSLGVPAENSGRNDVSVLGKKICGNAQWKHGKRLLHHGAILFDTDLEVLVKALNVSNEKIISKGIKSVKSRVTNIKEHLIVPLDILDFRNGLSNTILADIENSVIYKLSDSDLEAVRKLRDNKYSTWEWNYGSSPPFNVQNKRSFSWGHVDARTNVKKGLITGLKIYGDFFAGQDVDEFEKLLIGITYREENVREHLTTELIKRYFPQAELEEIVKLFF
jgi:lipoate-protein ligase A